MSVGKTNAVAGGQKVQMSKAYISTSGWLKQDFPELYEVNILFPSNTQTTWAEWVDNYNTLNFIYRSGDDPSHSILVDSVAPAQLFVKNSAGVAVLNGDILVEGETYRIA